MHDTRHLSELLDTLDKLFATLDEIARSKSSLIKSMVASGTSAATAVNDFYETVCRFTTDIDDTIREIKRLSRDLRPNQSPGATSGRRDAQI